MQLGRAYPGESGGEVGGVMQLRRSHVLLRVQPREHLAIQVHTALFHYSCVLLPPLTDLAEALL